MLDTTGVINEFNIKKFRNCLLLSFYNNKFSSHDNDEMLSKNYLVFNMKGITVLKNLM